MTDEEFQRLKETEKKHLRAKKRLQATLKRLKQRNEVQGVVQRMKQGARRLLDETESLVDRLRRAVAEREARFEVALDDSVGGGEDLYEAEETLRDERAEQLVREMKRDAADSSPARPSTTLTGEEGPDSETEADDTYPEGPDKTIGRMNDRRADEG